ncbi:hypothetical protein KSS87_003383 [Heliosperma pusillum]|nr:hypothetical protein KSS87_003383 [Heliosperma pusillum]
MDLFISITLTIFIIILVHHLHAIHLRRKKNLPPGQYGLPLIGETLQLMSAFKSDNPQPFIERRVARFGLIFTTHLFGEPTVFSADPDFNRFVLQNEFKLFESSYPTSISHLVGKHSLLLMKDGNLHKRLHTLTINFVGAANVRDHLFGGIDSLISSFLNFNDGKIFLMDETKKIAFALTVKLLMSIEPCDWTESLKKEYFILIAGFFALPLPFFSTTYTRAMKARGKVAKELTLVVKQRRIENGQGNNKKDIIGALLHEEAGRRGGRVFSDEEIADFLVAILVAGLETTSSSMTIAIKLLTDNPLALAQLKEEQDKIKAKNDNGKALHWDDYKSMVFTQCVSQLF